MAAISKMRGQHDSKGYRFHFHNSKGMFEMESRSYRMACDVPATVRRLSGGLRWLRGCLCGCTPFELLGGVTPKSSGWSATVSECWRTSRKRLRSLGDQCCAVAQTVRFVFAPVGDEDKQGEACADHRIAQAVPIVKGLRRVRFLPLPNWFRCDRGFLGGSLS